MKFSFALATAAASVSMAVATNTTAEVKWDTYGVPHIFSDTEEGLSYGYGYAHGRDHATLLLRMVAIGSSRSSEFASGPLWENFDANSYKDRIPQAVSTLYPLMRSQTVADFEAFAEGFNQYAAEHPEEFDDIIFAGLLPLTGPDIFSSNLRVLISFAFAGASGLSGAAKEHFNNIPDPRQAEVEADGKIHTSYMDWDPLDGMVPTELREYIGSNAWAANGASNRTTGNAMLDMNPHLAYLGFFRWYEAQLTCEECDINVYGANLVGIPNLQIAFNDHLGWTHTVNSIQPYSGFEVELHPEDDRKYMFDGEWRDMEIEENTFKSLQADGSYITTTVVSELTVHGAVTSRTAGRAIAVRLAGIDTDVKRPDAVTQWWDMGKAKTMEEFKDAMRTTQIPMFYTAVATDQGDILMNNNAWVPDRGEDKCDTPREAMRIVDGSTSETLWQDVLPWDDLPTVENPESGFVQNANESPWSFTSPIGEGDLDPDNYCKYIDSRPPFMGYRPQASFRLMTENTNMDFDKFLELKMSTLKEGSNHLVDDIVAAVDQYAADDEELQYAKTILANWDRQMDTDSVGSLLFESFLTVAPGSSSLYVNQWDLNEPLVTPNTLQDPEAAVGYLRTAVNTELARGRPLDMKYGDHVRMPTTDRAVASYPEQGGFLVCMIGNDCLADGIDIDCVVPIPFINPNPVCGDTLEPVSLLGCIATCDENIPCLLGCVQENVLFQNPFEPAGPTVPGNGCSDCFRNAYYFGGQAGAGDSWVGVVEFTPDGPIAKGSIAYGNASPYSRGADLGHINDQMQLFSDKELRTLWRSHADIDANLEERSSITTDLCPAGISGCTSTDEVCEIICA